jgi:hypothetical protein
MPAPIAVTPDKADVWEDVLEELFQELSELPTFWRDQPRPFVDADQDGFVTLFVTEDVVVGVPERRLVCNLAAPAGEEIEPTIAELHRLSLQVQVETYDNAAKQRGRFFASRLRTRLRTEAAELALARVETSLIDVSPIISAAVPIDNRQSSASTMTVRLHAATVERERPFGYIDVLRLVPDLEDEAGDPIPLASIDVDLPDP